MLETSDKLMYSKNLKEFALVHIKIIRRTRKKDLPLVHFKELERRISLGTV
jgi:hypothetical protein